jgi:hypothetical protein
LFFLKISVARVSSIVEAVLIIVLLVITAVAHILIHKSFSRKVVSIFPYLPSLTAVVAIINYLPMSLATKKMARRYERERQFRQGTNDFPVPDIRAFGIDRTSVIVTPGLPIHLRSFHRSQKRPEAIRHTKAQISSSRRCRGKIEYGEAR